MNPGHCGPEQVHTSKQAVLNRQHCYRDTIMQTLHRVLLYMAEVLYMTVVVVTGGVKVVGGV